MKNIPATSLIKLGTSIRYLKDVKYKITDNSAHQEPLGDKFVLSNMKTTLDLIEQPGFTGVMKSGDYNNFKKLYDELTKLNTTVPHITIKHAESLHDMAIKLRAQFHAQGNDIDVFYLNKTDPGYKAWSSWIANLTMTLLAQHPFKTLAGIVLFIATVFGAGMSFTYTKLGQEILSYFEAPEAEKPEGQTDDSSKEEAVKEAQ